MATLALTAAGSLVPGVGPILGPLLGAVGSYVDNNLILPGLFPPEDIEGPRLNEIRLQSAEEGSPARRIFGNENRLAGSIIWISDIEETKNTETVGGKGGGGQKTVTYEYFVSIAFAVAQHEIDGIDKIIAEGKVIYDEVNTNPSVNGTLTATVIQNGSFYPIYQIDSPSGGPDLSVFRPGIDAVITGFTNGSNNGTFEVVSSSFDASDGTSRVRFTGNTASVGEVLVAGVAISQTVPTFVSEDAQDIRIYTGGQTSPDSLIESLEDPTGIGSVVPPFKETSYVVIERLAMKKYGNRIPQVTFNVRSSSGAANVSTTISDIMTLAGRSGKYDVSGVSGTFRGYEVAGPASPAKLLQPLMLAFDVIEQEQGEDIVFFDRENATVIDIDADDLAAHVAGSKPTEYPIRVSDDNGAEIPAEVNVRYLDHEAENQYGSQRHRVQEFDSDVVMSINLPIVLNSGGSEARALAKRTAWLARANRTPVSLNLPYSYIDILENDVIRFKTLDHLWTLLVKQVDVGINGIISIDSILEVREIVTQSATAESPTNKTKKIFAAPPLVPVAFGYGGSGGGTPSPGPGPVPGGGKLGIHVVTSIPGEDPGWQGAKLRRSLDDDEFEDEIDITSEGVIGFTHDVLGSGSVGYWDRANTVDVEIFKGTLSSVTEIQCLNGFNRILLGDEVLGFQTATLISDQVWRLSKLIRGLRNTEDAVSTHVVGERAVFLNGQGIHFVPMTAAAIGQERFYKFVPAGGDEDDYDSISFTCQGDSAKPFSPVDLQSQREVPSTNAVRVTWKRRTREIVRLIGQLDPVPNLESFEKYEVEIWNAGETSLLRTEEIEDATTFDYTEAMQSTDGLTPGSTSFVVYVFQMGQYGRGNPSETLAVT